MNVSLMLIQLKDRVFHESDRIDRAGRTSGRRRGSVSWLPVKYTLETRET